MNRLLLTAAAVVAAGAFSGAEAAMRERSVEVGGYVFHASFDDESNIDDDVGFGGRIGFVFVPHHELELSLDRVETDDDLGLGLNVDLTSFKVGYVFNFAPFSHVSPLLTVGGGFQRLERSEETIFGSIELEDESDPLAFAGVGIRFFPGNVFNIRLDAQVTAVYPDGDGSDTFYDKIFAAGVGWVLGGR